MFFFSFWTRIFPGYVPYFLASLHASIFKWMQYIKDFTLGGAEFSLNIYGLYSETSYYALRIKLFLWRLLLNFVWAIVVGPF